MINYPNIFSLTIEAAEYSTEVVSNGKDALVRLAEVIPALVILDLHLPQCVSGKDILHEIRKDERLSNTRVILATADAFLSDELKEEADLSPAQTHQCRPTK